jgi:hemerythrin-like metal-binding protein
MGSNTSLIEWRDDFKIGIADVDYEHLRLIGLINGIYRELGERPDKADVSAALGEIHVKISAHFALEEKIMRERRYDQYADHKADHERLLDEIRDIMDAFEEAPGFDYAGAMVARVTPWFTGHFKTKDARLHRMLK